jgi:uncharacterized membrane protein YeaQ/YmgE (transglycosylase-associated protein family)
MEQLIISLLGGAAGGNIAGSLMKNFSLGTLWNSVVGILGGGLGAQLLSALGVATETGGMDIGSIIGNVASSGVGGGVLLVIVGFVRKAMKG